MLVGVAEPGQHLQHDRQRGARVGADPAVDRPLQVDALEELQRHERRALVLAELVDDDDVRVLQPAAARASRRKRARASASARPFDITLTATSRSSASSRPR